MKRKNGSMIVAWIVLWVLITFILIITYLKYFHVDNNTYIEEQPVNESSSNAIHTALKDITVNFNENSNVKEYCEKNNVTLTASLNNYSIYISYINDTSTTYEFTYNNLALNITVDRNTYDKIKFNTVYQFLIESAQKRLNNNNNIKSISDNFLNNDINYDGLTKQIINNEIKYEMNIAKKIKEN